MEFGLREVLIAVGFVVIAGILFDGYRRMRRSKLGELGLPSEMGGSCEDEGTYYNGELPNGGGRKVSLSTESPDNGRVEPGFADDMVPDIGDHAAESSDSVLVGDEDRIVDSSLGSVATQTDSFDDDGIGGVRRYSYDQELPSHESADTNEDRLADQNALFEDDDMLLSAKAAQEAKLASHYRGNDRGDESAPRKPESTTNHRSKKDSRNLESDQAGTATGSIDNGDEDMPINVDGLEEVIVLNLMAKSGESFSGIELDKALTSCGFRYGDMNIYHRFEQHVGRGPLLFSLANVVEPGVFDLDNLDEFSTPGVCMFMKLPGPKRTIHSFELMVECGRKIVSLLDGEMKDEHHSVMTQQTIEHYRQRVLDFDRKLLSRRVTQRS